MKSFLIIIVLIGAMGGAGYLYYQSTQAKIQQLIANNVTLQENYKTAERANLENESTIRGLEESYKKVQADYQVVLVEMQSIRAQNKELKDRLGKHDIAALAEAKPRLVEKVINGASKKAFRCMEILSGAPLTTSERNAENGNKFNSECPWLFDTIPNS